MEETVVKVAEDEKSPSEQRGKWSSNFQFFLAMLTYVYGMGSLWTFPYMCYSSGGASFFIPYIFMLVFIGIPFLYVEIGVGQLTGRGFISFYNMAPLFKGVGYVVVLASFFISIYYQVLFCYSLVYMVASFSGVWLDCTYFPVEGKCPEPSGPNETLDYFTKHIVQEDYNVSALGTIVWEMVIAVLLAYGLLFFGIFKGVRSLRKVVYFTGFYPVSVIVILLLRGVTLDGAGSGLKYFFSPTFQNLYLSGFATAGFHVIYSLGAGLGGAIAMASYRPFSLDIRRYVYVLPFVQLGCVIISGILTFSFTGFVAYQTGVEIHDLLNSEPWGIYSTIPKAIARLEAPRIWGFLFFSAFFVIGFGCQMIQMESVVVSLLDQYPRLKNKRLLVCGVWLFTMFLIGLCCITNAGLTLMRLFDAAVIIPVFISCLLELVVVAWIYGAGKFARDLQYMTKVRVPVFWQIALMIASVIVLCLSLQMFVSSFTAILNHMEDSTGRVFTVLITLVILSCILIYPIYWIRQQEGTMKERLLAGLRPNSSWGPQNDRSSWEEHQQSHPATWKARYLNLKKYQKTSTKGIELEEK